MIAPSLNFPVRPAWKTGESLWGYVHRLHDANGYQVPEHVYRQLQTLYGKEGHAKVAEAIDQVLQSLPNCELNRRWWCEAPVSSVWNGATWQDRMRHVNSIRICPACIARDGFHHALWELPLISVCPFHSCWLLRQCPSCSRLLTWSRRRVDWQCRCGCKLPSMRSRPAPDGLVELARFICNAVDVQRPTVHEQIPTTGWGPIDLANAYRVLQQLHGLRKVIVDKILCRSFPQHLSWVGATKARMTPHSWEGRQIQEWPKNFRATLLRLAKRYWRHRDETLLVIETNTAAYKLLHHIAIANRESWLVDPVQQVANELLAEHRLALYSRHLVLFNPNQSLAERQRRLKVFADWWKAFVAISRVEPHWPARMGHQLGHPADSEDRELAAIKLFSALLEDSVAGCNPGQYTRLIMAWPRPVVPKEREPERLITAVANQLLELDHGLLQRFSQFRAASRCRST